jgi:hypothetical protein
VLNPVQHDVVMSALTGTRHAGRDPAPTQAMAGRLTSVAHQFSSEGFNADRDQRTLIPKGDALPLLA